MCARVNTSVSTLESSVVEAHLFCPDEHADWCCGWCIATMRMALLIQYQNSDRNRVQIHQNDKSTKVQKDNMLWYSRERHIYFYACTFAAKAQKYKKYQKNPGRMGPYRVMKRGKFFQRDEWRCSY